MPVSGPRYLPQEPPIEPSGISTQPTGFPDPLQPLSEIHQTTTLYTTPIARLSPPRELLSPSHIHSGTLEWTPVSSQLPPFLEQPTSSPAEKAVPTTLLPAVYSAPIPSPHTAL
ncbi:hypothetical protein BDK51DRAFT_37498 [Blyttiomyces helicus]|uniref:Uncharacterized protein n=1 Tax=Blyttiomyces helicus TaxID=388810 RepID=A0A4P9WG36_9FUNG|nr:hypothetical protein BDK51DRAFT_37498 [Blyttiomyces helicus]|eukprot:RKO91759.1 hypothetical protein BDK51DRAFT_37498 [Blyttiomyces helicus]